MNASASAPASNSSAASPTTPPTTTGRLLEKGDEQIVLRILETSYRLHLQIDAPIEADLGDRVTGTIHCHARRVDVVPSGGRYIEPVYGRPRRIQGTIVGGDVQNNTLFVRCGATVIVHLMPSQRAADFMTGQMASFDVERGAKFVGG